MLCTFKIIGGAEREKGADIAVNEFRSAADVASVRNIRAC